MKNLRVVFMGTPIFSVPILNALINNTTVELVVTAPDSFMGRKKILTPCHVKKLATAHDLEVFSPEKISQDFERIKEVNPDIIITAAYGQFISEAILNIPRLGCINVHPSLLPKYRGGAPIHHALMNGDAKTGVTLMYMDKGMDSGDIIAIEEMAIDAHDTLDTLSNKLALLGAEMVIKYLPSIIDGTASRTPQNHAEMVLSPIIKRADEHLDFSQTKERCFNLLRALTPSPFPYFLLDGIEMKIVEARKVEATGQVGTIVDIDKESFTIMCSDGGLKITKIKPFGKTIMLVRDYFNGIDASQLLGKEVN